MKRILIAAVLAACGATGFASPGLDAVRAEVAHGHDIHAEEMIRELLAAQPDSAGARYVHAQILAHLGRFTQAAEEAVQARRLDPGLSFTQPEAFKSFEAMLARAQASTAGMQAPSMAPHMTSVGSSSGVPDWVWGGGLALLVALALHWLKSSRPPASVSFAPAPRELEARPVDLGAGHGCGGADADTSPPVGSDSC